MRWHMKHTICQTQHSPCIVPPIVPESSSRSVCTVHHWQGKTRSGYTRLVLPQYLLQPSTNTHTYVGRYVCKYLKTNQIYSINLSKCNNAVHLCRLGSGVPSTWSSIALKTLSTVSLSGLLPLCTHTFLSLELLGFLFQFLGPHFIVGPLQHLEEGAEVLVTFATEDVNEPAHLFTAALLFSHHLCLTRAHKPACYLLQNVTKSSAH